MAEKFDAAILGMEPGGEVVSGKPLTAGKKKVAVVEKELIGGDRRHFGALFGKKVAGVLVVRPADYPAGEGR